MQTFLQRVEEMHERSRVNLASFLGDVAAHEIGHLLLARTRTRRTESCAHAGKAKSLEASAWERFFFPMPSPGK